MNKFTAEVGGGLTAAALTKPEVILEENIGGGATDIDTCNSVLTLTGVELIGMVCDEIDEGSDWLVVEIDV